MTTYQLGKLPAVRPHRLADLDSYVLGKPPQPPAEVAPPDIADWGMFANGPDPACSVAGAPFGDCVVAGDAHGIIALNAVLGTNDRVPNSDQAATEYLGETGGQDTGLVISAHLERWRSSGIFADDGSPNRLAAYAPVSNGSVLATHRAVDLFRLCKMGFQLPESAQQQFQAGQPFTVVPGAQIAGGHDMECVGYSQQWFYLVTWGRLVRASYPFIETYADERYALLLQSVKEKGHGPTNVDFASLEADLGTLGE